MSAFGGKADIVDERRLAFGCSHLQARAWGHGFKETEVDLSLGPDEKLDQGQESERARSD